MSIDIMEFLTLIEAASFTRPMGTKGHSRGGQGQARAGGGAGVQKECSPLSLGDIQMALPTRATDAKSVSAAISDTIWGCSSVNSCLEAVAEALVDIQVVRCTVGLWRPLWLGAETTYDLLVRHRGHFLRLLRVNDQQPGELYRELSREATLAGGGLPGFPEEKRWRMDPWNNFNVALLADRSHSLQLFFHNLLEQPSMHCDPLILRFVDMWGTMPAMEGEEGMSPVSRGGEALCHWLDAA